jgi:hypothetical protein
MKLSTTTVRLSALALPTLALAVWATTPKVTQATIQGYVLDSACTYTKGLDKPISRECAIACAKAGSPLVLLSADGTVYLPISEAPPAVGQNEKLLPFAGQKVITKGKVFERNGSHAIVIEKIEAQPASQ